MNRNVYRVLEIAVEQEEPERFVAFAIELDVLGFLGLQDDLEALAKDENARRYGYERASHAFPWG